MTRVAVCTDSSALLTPAAADLLGVDVVPVEVTLNGQPLDGALSIDDFYERLRSGARATTSQPSQLSFEHMYQRAAGRGARHVVSIHLDARTSGTAASAELAATDAPLPVTVVDSGTVSFGVGVCVRAAAVAAAEGHAPHDVETIARQLGAGMQNAFVARSNRTGRVPQRDVWTLFQFAGGESLELESCDSLEDATAAMVQHVLADGRVAAAVGHAARELEPAADELAYRLLKHGRVANVERYRVGPSVGAHTGPDSFGVFWWPS